jgi:hypothetical protein
MRETTFRRDGVGRKGAFLEPLARGHGFEYHAGNRAVGEPFRPSVAGVRTVTESNGDAAPKAGIPVHLLRHSEEPGSPDPEAAVTREVSTPRRLLSSDAGSLLTLQTRQVFGDFCRLLSRPEGWGLVGVPDGEQAGRLASGTAAFQVFGALKVVVDARILSETLDCSIHVISDSGRGRKPARLSLLTENPCAHIFPDLEGYFSLPAGGLPVSRPNTPECVVLSRSCRP